MQEIGFEMCEDRNRNFANLIKTKIELFAKQYSLIESYFIKKENPGHHANVVMLTDRKVFFAQLLVANQ